MNHTKLNLPQEVRDFFAEIGRKNGKKLFKERGSQYFKDIAAKRKTHGRQGKVNSSDSNTYQALADTYKVSRQRIHQIIKQHGQKLLDRSKFDTEDSWREAVIKEYFSKKSNL